MRSWDTRVATSTRVPGRDSPLMARDTLAPCRGATIKEPYTPDKYASRPRLLLVQQTVSEGREGEGWRWWGEGDDLNEKEKKV